MTPLAIVIASDIGYLVGIGVTFQLAARLKGNDVYGRPSNAWRWLASCVWPVTACIATGITFARWFQKRGLKLPRAIVHFRCVQDRE